MERAPYPRNGDLIRGTWKDEYVDAWSKYESVGPHQAAHGRLYGLPTERPRDNVQTLKLLIGAGFPYLDVAKVLDTTFDDVVHQANRHVNRDLAQTLTMHAWGYTVNEIADELGVKRPWIYYHLKDRGIHPHISRNEPLTASQRQTILESFSGGERMYKIARRLGVSYDQVRNCIRRAK